MHSIHTSTSESEEAMVSVMLLEEVVGAAEVEGAEVERSRDVDEF